MKLWLIRGDQAASELGGASTRPKDVCERSIYDDFDERNMKVKLIISTQDRSPIKKCIGRKVRTKTMMEEGEAGNSVE